MNKKLGLAVAGAVLALSTTANAGITIPAGDWTLDISGNVNAYYQNTRFSGGTTPIVGSLNYAAGTGRDASNDRVANGINTGLLPAWIGFSGKTRQNDLDVSFTISFQPGVSENSVTGDGAVNASGFGGSRTTFLNRQTFLQFGDASWGSIKLGKDLGIFGSDAILNDMTLLGVGAGGGLSGSADNTTLGGIGTGYIYAAWKGQITYQTPNWNGFQATVGLINPNMIGDANSATGLTPTTYNQDRLGVEGKLNYTWAGDVSGKAWFGFANYDVTQGNGGVATATTTSYTINAYELGANANMGNLGVTGYYYRGSGLGTTFMGWLGANAAGKTRDSRGGYIQATYVIPTGTKIGASYGVSKLDDVAGDVAALVEENRRWTIGAYHPLTKSLNLVAEYNDVRTEAQSNTVDAIKSKNVSLGAILFF